MCFYFSLCHWIQVNVTNWAFKCPLNWPISCYTAKDNLKTTKCVEQVCLKTWLWII